MRISYILDSGSWPENYSPQDSELESLVINELPAEAPVREGSVFLGWCDGLSGEYIWKTPHSAMMELPEYPLVAVFDEPHEGVSVVKAKLNSGTANWFSGWPVVFKIKDPVLVYDMGLSEGIRKLLVLDYYRPDFEAQSRLIRVEQDEDGQWSDEQEVLWQWGPSERLKWLDFLTFSIKEEEGKTYKYSFETLDPGYNKLRSMDISWQVQINKGSGGYAQQIISQVTYMAYVLQSPEFRVVVENWKDIIGRDLPNDWKGDEVAFRRVGVGIPETQTQPLFGTRYQNKYMQLCVVHGGYTGGAYCANISNGKQLAAKTTGSIGSTDLPINHWWAHELGHSFDYGHNGSWAMKAPMTDWEPMVISTLGALMAQDLPYYKFLRNDGRVRVGYTKLEKWIIEHPEKFERGEEFKARLLAQKDQRNQKVQQLKSAEAGAPPIPALKAAVCEQWLSNNGTQFDQLYYNRGQSTGWYLQV